MIYSINELEMLQHQFNFFFIQFFKYNNDDDDDDEFIFFFIFSIKERMIYMIVDFVRKIGAVNIV